MKQFFKMVFATMVGMLLFGLLTFFLGVMCIIGMLSSGNASVSLRDNSVMVMKLSGLLDERSESSALGALTGNDASFGLDDVLTAIRKAKDNDEVKGIYIEAGLFAADSYATVQAVRRALSDFRASGKWVVAYADTYTQSSYYLASVADKVYLNPSGQIDWHGIAAQPYFVKDLMAKFGVKMQLSKVGAYKSAPELFTADKMSDANREQVTAYVNGIWENIVREVSESRKVSADSLNAYADRLITFDDPQNYVQYKLIDGLMYTDEVKKEVKQRLSLNDDEFINQVSVVDMSNVKSKREGEEIAVYYAYGDIVDGGGQGMLSSHVIDAQVVCKDLEKLQNDGLCRAIGVSNFKQTHLEALLESGIQAPPQVNQTEIHPMNTEEALVRFCREHGIAAESYSPLGGGGRTVLDDPRLIGICNHYHKTPAQVVLRWHLQRGLVVIPKSSRPERILSNSQLYDFDMSQGDLEIIGDMDNGERRNYDPDKIDERPWYLEPRIVASSP